MKTNIFHTSNTLTKKNSLRQLKDNQQVTSINEYYNSMHRKSKSKRKNIGN